MKITNPEDKTITIDENTASVDITVKITPAPDFEVDNGNFIIYDAGEPLDGPDSATNLGNGEFTLTFGTVNLYHPSSTTEYDLIFRTFDSDDEQIDLATDTFEVVSV